MKRHRLLPAVLAFALMLSTTFVSATDIDDQGEQSVDYSDYYQVVAEINEEYGTNFSISGFEQNILFTPAEFASYLENFAVMTITAKVPNDYDLKLSLPQARAAGPYYEIVPVRINSFFYMNVEVAYRIADNGNDLYFVQNTSDDRYTFSPIDSVTYGFVEVTSYTDYISSDRIKLYIDLQADCYLSSGGIVILADTVDDTFRIHINDIA